MAKGRSMLILLPVCLSASFCPFLSPHLDVDHFHSEPIQGACKYGPFLTVTVRYAVQYREYLEFQDCSLVLSTTADTRQRVTRSNTRRQKHEKIK
jgi:hypothetical protein